MADKKTAVFGIYSTRDGVERATDAMVKSGFSTADISVLLPENLGGLKDIGTEKSTKAPEGARAGAASGATIGGVLGLLAGIGALAIPGLNGRFSHCALHELREHRTQVQCPWLDPEIQLSP